MKELLIIDGRHLFWRAYDTFRDLVVELNGEEIPIGGVYGFLLVLIRVYKKFGCKLVICWEGKNNFRYKIYPDYKNKGEIDADRKLLIEEMKSQEIRLKALLRNIGIVQYKSICCEADDTMGALANRFVNKNKNNRAIIYTGDSDLRQLVDDQIAVFAPCKGGFIKYDRNSVFEKHGVYPEYIADLKALSGDSSDNIPGIRGIGPKTAVKLINQYGTIDQIIDNLNSSDWPIADRFRKLIDDNLENLKLFKELTTIKLDVKLVKIKEKQNWDKVRKNFAVYKFLSLMVPQEFRQLVKMAG